MSCGCRFGKFETLASGKCIISKGVTKISTNVLNLIDNMTYYALNIGALSDCATDLYWL